MTARLGAIGASATDVDEREISPFGSFGSEGRGRMRGRVGCDGGGVGGICKVVRDYEVKVWVREVG